MTISASAGLDELDSMMGAEVLSFPLPLGRHRDFLRLKVAGVGDWGLFFWFFSLLFGKMCWNVHTCVWHAISEHYFTARQAIKFGTILFLS